MTRRSRTTSAARVGFRRPARRGRLGLATILIVAMMGGGFQTQGGSPGTNAATEGVLLNDPLGRPVSVGADQVPSGLLPPARLGMSYQIPATRRGSTSSELTRRRREGQRAGDLRFRWFPSRPAALAPYLEGLDELGNTAVRPDPLLRFTPVDGAVQQGKYRLAEIGLHYSLQQTLTLVAMNDVMQGDPSLGFYTFDLTAKWAVFDTGSSGRAGWISVEAAGQAGLGWAGRTQSAQVNLGTLTNPSGVALGEPGVQLPELAWQQSFREGRLVAVTGLVDQGSYLDANAYANSGAQQFLNSALINSMVLPLPSATPGINLQWQPHDTWHVLLGTSVGNSQPGTPPWTDWSADTWAVVGEAGYAPADVVGLGPGVYRLQPFIAQAGGPARGGVALNAQQQLGRESNFGWFGRFGWADAEATAGASAQLATGLVMQGGLIPRALWPRNAGNDAGIGFVWSRPSAAWEPTAHENEYVLEVGHGFLLTPTTLLRPDLQLVWNPIKNPGSSRALVFQLQLATAW